MCRVERLKFRSKTVFDGVINMQAGCCSCSSGNAVDNTCIVVRFTDLASYSLRFAVLGESSRGREVTKAFVTLKFFATMGRRFEMLNESGWAVHRFAGETVSECKGWKV